MEYLIFEILVRKPGYKISVRLNYAKVLEDYLGG